MSPQDQDLRLVDVMLGAAMLTPDQARRVRQTVRSGKTLTDALASTPIVEPMHYLKARQLLAGGTPPETGFGAGAESPNFIGWKPEPVLPGDTEETPIPGTMGLSAVLQHAAHGAGARFEPPASIEAVDPAGYLVAGTPARYDLAEDEGIPLLREVYALLRGAIDQSARGLTLWDDGHAVHLARYDYAGALCKPLERMDYEVGPKAIHRLVIMARIPPWRAEEARGAFDVARPGGDARVYVAGMGGGVRLSFGKAPAA